MWKEKNARACHKVWFSSGTGCGVNSVKEGNRSLLLSSSSHVFCGAFFKPTAMSGSDHIAGDNKFELFLLLCFIVCSRN